MPTLEERLQRVEEDKAWETSWFRRITIAILTYICAIIFLDQIEEAEASLKALIPVGGYLISTLTLPAIKQMWLR